MIDGDRIPSEIAEPLTTPLLVRRPMLAFLISVSERTVAQLQADRKIPFVKVGKCVRYNPVAVLAALENKRRMGRLEPQA